MNMQRIKRYLKSLTLLIPALVFTGHVIAQPTCTTPAPPSQDALDALASNFAMTVTDTPLYIRFQSPLLSVPKGLVIHPGGCVDPRAYAVIARKIAANGYRVLIMKTPSELIVAGVLPSLVGTALASETGVTKWALGGHSVGGVAAAQWIFDNPTSTAVKGLALWASYVNPAKALSSRIDIKGLSIAGSQDCVLPPATVAQFNWAAPPGTIFQVMTGANHAQWGDYGPQSGDCAATITRLQQKINGKNSTIDNLLQLL
jgi:pimeloyl-ACP methyl ester carboxylesterase